jgi:hypothetical protein
LRGATEFARASDSATVVIASTSSASYSLKIKVELIGSKPSASPKSPARSATIAFPGRKKRSHQAGSRRQARSRAWSLSVHLCRPFGSPFDVRASGRSRRDSQKRDDESIGRRYRRIAQYGLDIFAKSGAYSFQKSQYQVITNTIVRLIRKSTSSVIAAIAAVRSEHGLPQKLAAYGSTPMSRTVTRVRLNLHRLRSGCWRFRSQMDGWALQKTVHPSSRRIQGGCPLMDSVRHKARIRMKTLLFDHVLSRSELDRKSSKRVDAGEPTSGRPGKSASSGAIPSWLAPFLRVQVRADFRDARAAEAIPHL